MKVKEVESVVQYLDYICKNFIPNEKTHLHYYYRGVPYRYKTMIPNLYRDVQFVEHGSEYYYRRMFSRLGMNDYSSGAELLKDLAEFQHYGAKTSLLDVSLNPLISLYMAVEKSEKDGDALDQDGHVYLFKSQELGVEDETALEEKFDTGHTAAIKCALSLIDHEKTNKFLEAIEHLRTLPNFNESFTEKELRSGFADSEEECVKAIHEFMELLNQRARVKERLLYPFRVYEDMISAQIVIPSICTERIRNQQGAFILPCHPIIENSDRCRQKISDSVWEKIIFEFIIPSKLKKQIREQLSCVGITRDFVYPGIDNSSEVISGNARKR